MHSTHTQGMRGGVVVGVGGGGVRPSRLPSFHPYGVNRMLGTIGVGGCGGFRGVGGGGVRQWQVKKKKKKKREREEGVKRISVPDRTGPRGSKGDTEGPLVSLPNHCVALRGEGQGGGGWGGRGESYKEEGEVEEEEERR